MKLFVSGSHNVLFTFGLLLLIFCFYSTFKMFLLEWDVKVQSEDLVCEQPLNNRCASVFTMIDNNGNLTKTTVFMYLFQSEDLLVGNHIEKNIFSFRYKVNGIEKTWSDGFTILKFFAVSAILIIIWLSPRVRPK